VVRSSTVLEVVAARVGEGQGGHRPRVHRGGQGSRGGRACRPRARHHIELIKGEASQDPPSRPPLAGSASSSGALLPRRCSSVRNDCEQPPFRPNRRLLLLYLSKSSITPSPVCGEADNGGEV
jgi:hypothetical protein